MHMKVWNIRLFNHIKSAQDIEKEIVQPCVYYCSITDPLGTKCKISRAPLGKLEKVLVSWKTRVIKEWHELHFCTVETFWALGLLQSESPFSHPRRHARVHGILSRWSSQNSLNFFWNQKKLLFWDIHAQSSCTCQTVEEYMSISFDCHLYVMHVSHGSNYNYYRHVYHISAELLVDTSTQKDSIWIETFSFPYFHSFDLSTVFPKKERKALRRHKSVIFGIRGWTKREEPLPRPAWRGLQFRIILMIVAKLLMMSKVLLD